MSIRRKRKADTYHLNIVRKSGGSSKRHKNVRIERVSIPFSSHVGDNESSKKDVENDVLPSEVSISQGSLIESGFQGDAHDGASSEDIDNAESTSGQKTAYQVRSMGVQPSIYISARCGMQLLAKSTLPILQ